MRTFADVGVNVVTSTTYRIVAYNVAGDSTASTTAEGKTGFDLLASNSWITASQDTSLTVNAANGLLAHDYNPLGDTVVINLVRTPQHGTLALDDVNGGYTYTPTPDYSGPDFFTYHLATPQRTSLLGTVHINVKQTVAAPTNLDATRNTDGAVGLTWNASPGAHDGYIVQYSDGDTVDDVFWNTLATVGASETSFTDSGVPSDETKYYRVMATRGDLQSDPSNIAVVSDAAPDVPAGVHSTNASPTEIDLAWESSADATSYVVYRLDPNGLDFAQVGTVAGNATTYAATGLVRGQNYIFRISAKNSAGESDPSDDCETQTHQTTPNAPTAATATTVSNDRIDVHWTDNSDNEDGFRIEVSANGSSFTQIAEVGANATAYSDTDLDSNTTYSYRIYSVNAAGDSTASATASATTPSIVTAAPPLIEAPFFGADLSKYVAYAQARYNRVCELTQQMRDLAENNAGYTDLAIQQQKIQSAYNEYIDAFTETFAKAADVAARAPLGYITEKNDQLFRDVQHLPTTINGLAPDGVRLAALHEACNAFDTAMGVAVSNIRSTIQTAETIKSTCDAIALGAGGLQLGVYALKYGVGAACTAALAAAAQGVAAAAVNAFVVDPICAYAGFNPAYLRAGMMVFQIFSAYKAGNSACFATGTIVHSESGLRPIESLRKGDRVWAFNFMTQKWELATLIQADSRIYQGLMVDLNLGSQQVRCTAEHPIWVSGGENLNLRPEVRDIPTEESKAQPFGRWVEAQHVQRGDVLLSRDGSIVQVEHISFDASQEMVHSLHVDGHHCFAVGNGGILAQNGCPPLRRDMIKAKTTFGTGEQAAHIAPVGAFSNRSRAVQDAILLAQTRLGGLINNRVNGFKAVVGCALGEVHGQQPVYGACSS